MGMSVNLDMGSVEPEADREPLPSGQYPMAVVKSAEKATKTGNGTYAQLVLQVTRGGYAGRQVYDNLNINHSKDQPREIARRRLRSICDACGKGENFFLSDTQEIENIEMLVSVRFRPATGEYRGSNDVEKYEALNAQPAAPASQQAAPAQPQGQPQPQAQPAPAEAQGQQPAAAGPVWQS